MVIVIRRIWNDCHIIVYTNICTKTHQTFKPLIKVLLKPTYNFKFSPSSVSVH